MQKKPSVNTNKRSSLGTLSEALLLEFDIILAKWQFHSYSWTFLEKYDMSLILTYLCCSMICVEWGLHTGTTSVNTLSLTVLSLLCCRRKAGAMRLMCMRFTHRDNLIQHIIADCSVLPLLQEKSRCNVTYVVWGLHTGTTSVNKLYLTVLSFLCCRRKAGAMWLMLYEAYTQGQP